MEFKFAQVITNILKKNIYCDPTIAFKPLMFKGWNLNVQRTSRRQSGACAIRVMQKKTVGVDTHQNYLANTAQHGNGPFPL